MRGRGSDTAELQQLSGNAVYSTSASLSVESTVKSVASRLLSAIDECWNFIRELRFPEPTISINFRQSTSTHGATIQLVSDWNDVLEDLGLEMDPATALGIAAAAVQVIKVGLKTLTLCKQIRDSDTDTTLLHAELQRSTRQLETIQIGVTLDSFPRETSRSIKQCSQDCCSTAKEL